MAERNEPCPCMSGLKYKKCCYKRELILKKIPCQTYYEGYILQDLLEHSPQFKSFYEAERSKISRNIIWAYDPELVSNVRATYLPKINENLIACKNLPLSSEDAFDTAHELQHFICNEEGYPSVKLSELLAGQTNSNLAIALSSSLNDPIVNKRLLPFAFDLWSQYDKDCASEKTYMEKIDEPQAPTEKLYYTAYYIAKALLWDVCCLTSVRNSNDFLEWYDSHFPNFSPEARETLSWIKKLGYETPEKAEAVYTKLITQFELDKSLKIITYPA
ncbi:MAG TPA: SEC-C domain-containing protein [Desulfitobacteriaceae bacterium]|nr:SEC-C domain-containing protein [Desulfitobacteriaceae bacterium]